MAHFYAGKLAQFYSVANTISVIEEFLHESTDLPRPLSPLINTLLSPPIGVRPGVIPVLMAAVMQTFPLPLNVLDDGVYVREFKAELFERMLLAPDKVTVQCIRLGQAVDTYLSALPTIFGPLSAEPESVRSQRRLLQLALERLYQWLHQVPSCTMTTQNLRAPTLTLRATLVKATDPAALIFREIPQVYLPNKEFKNDSFEVSVNDYEAVLKGLRESVLELDSYKTTLLERATIIVGKLFSPASGLQNGSITDRVRAWLAELSKDIKEFLDDPQCAGFVTRAMSKYESDSMLIESLASLVTGRSISYWDDSFLRQFELASLQIRKKIISTDSLLRLRDDLAVDGERSNVRGGPDVIKRLIRGSYGLPERLMALKSDIGSVLGEHLKGLTREERAGVLMALLKEEL